MRKTAILKNSEIFHELTYDECRELIKLIEERTEKAGIVIAREGEDAKYLFLCVEGEMRVEMNVGFKESMELAIATVEPGKIAGWSAILKHGRYTATVRTVKDSKLFVFERGKLLDFFSKRPEIGFRVLQSMLEVASHRLLNSRVQLLNCVLDRKK